MPSDVSINQINSANTAIPTNSGVLTILMQNGKISSSDMQDAKIKSTNENKSIEDVLLQSNKISEEDLYQAKALALGYKYAPVASMEIPINILNKVSRDVAHKNVAIPFAEDNGKIKVAMADPDDLQKVKFLQIIIAKPLELYLSSPTQINTVIDKQYGSRITTEVEEAMEDFGDVVEIGDGSGKTSDSSSEDLDSAPVSRIVNMILEYAAKYKASDVHIEPHENKVIVRFRISGILVEKLTLPRKLALPVVSRIKILSTMKIDEHRLPQDGRFQMKFANVIYDMRVSVIPSVYGEKVVMRLLETGGGQMRIEDTGLRGFALRSYLDALKKTEGIILVTGPTGSGKTHTLASSLKILNTPSVNIVTIEDPVEIRVEGVTQVQVHPEIGLTFSNGLRSFLRQDPDIIMVGEIRDAETAELAVQAALVGRLVLATLHTNSAAGAIPRLLDMGIESFLLSSTVNVIMAQRLARKLCNNCKQGYIASNDEVAKLHQVLDGLKGFDLYHYPLRRDNAGNVIEPTDSKVTIYKAVGCDRCNGSGYDGRVGVFEVLPVSSKIAQMIMEHRSTFEIHNQAMQDGMISIVQDGFLKVLEGITTLSEVLRVSN